MGHLANRIDVDKVRFKLMPVAIWPQGEAETVYDSDPSLRDIEDVYILLHSIVFRCKPRGRVGRSRDLIAEGARRAGVSIKLFMLANMCGWDHSHNGIPFFAKSMTGDFAVKQVKKFAEVCRERYGTFDVTSLDMLMGTDAAQKDLDSIMLNSEVIAGTWIVSYKIFYAGDMYRKLYDELELSLHPSWLAIEPTYKAYVLNRHIKEPFGTERVKAHRWNVMHTMREMKRDNRLCQSRMFFRKREQIMPQAVRKVLAMRNFRPDHFQMEDSVVVNALKFWGRLGQAVQHYECLNFVDKLPSAFDSYLAARRFGSDSEKQHV